MLLQARVQHPSIKDTFVNRPKLTPVTTKAKDAAVYHGRIANYDKQTAFEMPPEIVARIEQWGGAAIKQLGDDVWEITKAATGLLPRPINHSDTQKGIIKSHRFSVDNRFGLSPAEFVFVDNQILASVTKKNSTKLLTPRRPRRVQNDAKVEFKPETEMNDDPVLTPEPAPTLVETDMRALLAGIRTIEATTPYRLAKLKDTGVWAFVAPTIK